MPRLRPIFLAACIASLWITGCGDDSSGGDATTVEEIPQLFADAVCGTLSNCGPYFALSAGEECEVRSRASLENGPFSHVPAAIEAGTLVYDGSQVPSCIDAIEEVGCDLFGGARIPDTCLEAFDGQVAIGDECSIDEECEGTAVCLGTDSCPGTCTARIAEGGDCEDSDHCEDGLTCSGGQCHPTRKQGDACGGELPPCAGGLVCAGEDGNAGEPGSCEPFEEVFVGTEGDDCDFMAGVFCETGLACVITLDQAAGQLDQVCEKPVGSGEACKLAFFNHCPDGEYCAGLDPDGGVFEGTCEDLPGDGMPCAEAAITPCATGRACVGGTCKTMRENGGSCDADDECFSEHCDGGTCTAPPACTLDAAD